MEQTTGKLAEKALSIVAISARVRLSLCELSSIMTRSGALTVAQRASQACPWVNFAGGSVKGSGGGGGEVVVVTLSICWRSSETGEWIQDERRDLHLTSMNVEPRMSLRPNLRNAVFKQPPMEFKSRASGEATRPLDMILYVSSKQL